ncbi:excinuclease ABC subunit UvrC [Spiribacter sp. C176]|uniref:UvrABC system protein C n=1 Tax=Spiribacter salilacus TaxID=2664894 RepID=A0A6N7QXC6_9GAMM|nr:excinuclease ABC subunit UvrC [Spiribacter salilacus]MRH77314.1 excinuclease ABC subunit UvrC [Spiribacter salilacus]
MTNAVKKRIDGILKTLPNGPGVYRMLDADGGILYVGKARSLKRRVTSYFRGGAHNAKTQALVGQIRDIAITVTHTEAEALILENTLIKSHQPRYNVLLRDDKSYPYIYLSTEQTFPRLTFHRGQARGKGRYFGPFPSATAVRDTLNHLQRVFPVRQCRDSFFRHRTRPCLQYQIGRCTGPCVGLVSESDYAKDVRHVEMFLSGQSTEVIDELIEQMEAASLALNFEHAAQLRDRISSLRRIQERQYVAGAKGDVDVIACRQREHVTCVQIFIIRDGRNLGNRTYFPKAPVGTPVEEVLSQFLARHYLGQEKPPELIINQTLDDTELLEEALSQEAGRRVHIRSKVRGERLRWLGMAERNVEHALSARMATDAVMEERFEALRGLLEMERPINRIECFDISHTQGEATVASCVVFGPNGGAIKDDYRRFNIEGVAGGDDYAAMEQAIRRRYTRVLNESGELPDIVLIDGGKGQLSRAEAVIAELGLEGLRLVSIAKGPRRRAGEEVLLVSDPPATLHPPAESPALHLLQQARDEAHRFAITGHRQRRGKSRSRSVLEDIPGIGARRRQALIKQFGGLKGLKRAGVEDLARVPGISKALAEQIYSHLTG